MQFYNVAPSSPAATVRIPLFSSSISAGFPSPADDYVSKTIDLNEILIDHPAATFLVHAAGNSMVGAGIFDGDLLVVDRALTPKKNDIVIAYHEGEFLVKRLVYKNSRYFLVAENKSSAFKPLPVSNSIIIWGVVSGVLRSLKQDR